MRIKWKRTFLLIVYLPALALVIELIAKLRGHTPIQTVPQKSNNIFYGILDNCSEIALKNKSSNIEPAKLTSNSCITSPIKYVLNTKPLHETAHNSEEFKTKSISNDLGLRLPNGRITSEIAMFGDSFTNGHGVQGDERFSWIVHKKCGTPVFNASYANGFTVEHYDYFIKSNPWLKPKIAIINLFTSNDLDADLHETYISTKHPELISLPSRAISKSGNLISYLDIEEFPARQALFLARHSSAGRWLLEKIKSYQHKKGSIPIANKANSKALYIDGTISADAKARTTDSLTSISRHLLTRRKDAKVIVAVIPDSLTDLNENRMKANNKNIIKQLQSEIAKTTSRKNISFINMADHLESSNFFRLDRHYNSSGHKKHAEQLVKYLKKMPGTPCNTN